MSAERPGWFGELLTIVIADAAVVTLAALTVLAFWSRRVILLPIALIAHAGLDLFRILFRWDSRRPVRPGLPVSGCRVRHGRRRSDAAKYELLGTLT